MCDLLTYMAWRGDLTFKQAPLNEVDCLIFSVLSYLTFDGILVTNEQTDHVTYCTMYEALKTFFDMHQSPDETLGKLLPKETITLAKMVMHSNRFGNITLSDYVCRNDMDTHKQFCALTFHLNKRLHYIVYRGTDDTLNGWMEDFYMSIYANVASQVDAKVYLEHIAAKYHGQLLLGGHSKGGNLAVYASVCAPKKIQKRIILVSNHDGPGLKKEMLQEGSYAEMAEKIRSYVPQSSIFGMMFEHEKPYKIVKSNEKGIMQHNPFSWEICGKQFVTQKELSKQSICFDAAFKELIVEMNTEQKSRFVEGLFQVISQGEYMKLSQINLKSLFGMIRSYNEMDEQTKTAFCKTIRSFVQIYRRQFQKRFDKCKRKQKNDFGRHKIARNGCKIGRTIV